MICHVAARADVDQSSEQSLAYVRTNVLGTTMMLEMAREFNAKNFVFVSSNRVYSKKSCVPFQEKDATDEPSSIYAATKKSGEVLVRAYHHLYGFPCTCLRLFTVYGPFGGPGMLSLQRIDALSSDTPLTLTGSKNRMRDFIYIDDVVDGVLRALFNSHDFEIFNICSGKPVSQKEFIETVEHVVGKKAEIIEQAISRAEIQQGGMYGSFEKARKLLGFAPRVSLEEGLKRVYEWYSAITPLPSRLHQPCIPSDSAGIVSRDVGQGLRRTSAQAMLQVRDTLRVLVVSPHPDDDVIGCGGSIAKHIIKKHEVTIVYLSSGEAENARFSKEKLARIRENEAMKATDLLGVNERIFLRHPDGRLKEHTQAITADLERIIKDKKPYIIYLPHKNEDHEDHKTTYHCGMQALARASLSLSDRFLDQPWIVPLILWYEVWTPLQEISYMRDITPYITLKMRALKQHASQIMRIKYHKAVKGLNRFRGIMSRTGKYSEGFCASPETALNIHILER